MRKNLRNRLVGTAALAFLGFAACNVTVQDDTTGSGGSTSTGTTSGTAGTVAAAGGSSGAGGSSSTAGAAGQSSSKEMADGGVMFVVPDASLPTYTDASYSDSAELGCINDPTDGGEAANPDICGTLNGANTAGDTCGYDTPAGLSLCALMQQNARPGAFKVFFDCINQQTKADPCADVNVCIDVMHWPTGCQVGKVVVSNGKSWDCTNLVDRCGPDSGFDGFTLPECDFIMNAFNDDARTKIFDCYLSKPGATDPSTCKSDFTDCVFNPDQL
jgi:hypothetical protein